MFSLFFKRETTFIRHCHSPMVAQMDSVHIYIIFIMRTFLFYNDNPGEYKWLFNIRIDDLIVCNMILSRSSNEKSNFFLKLSNSLKMVPLDPISTPIISISFRLYCNFRCGMHGLYMSSFSCWTFAPWSLHVSNRIVGSIIQAFWVLILSYHRFCITFLRQLTFHLLWVDTLCWCDIHSECCS